MAAELGPACRRLADRLAYRPRELVVVTLLAAGLCGGLAVERWRARHSEIAERLEAEPPRLGTAAAAGPRPRLRPRPVARCEAPGGDARSGRRAIDSAGAAVALDLNRATPGEIARLAGISWGLAARIVAARDAGVPMDPGAGWSGRARGPAHWRARVAPPPAPPAAEPPPPAVDTEPLDEPPDATPR